MQEINCNFEYCPKCGSKNTVLYKAQRQWVCENCGFNLFNNVAAAVGVIIQNQDGKILLEKRAKKPRKGFLALPGGFVDPDESAENAALRECFEETGLQPESVSFICSFPNTYDYNGIRYKTCDVFFSAKLSEETSCNLEKFLVAQETEVSEFVLEKVSCAEDIEKLPLAFPSAKFALKKYLLINN